MAKPWESTFARLVDKRMTPDPKRVELDIHGDPICLNPIEYDYKEYRTSTGRIVREPVMRSLDWGLPSGFDGDIFARPAAMPKKLTPEELFQDMKKIMFSLGYGGRPDLDYRTDPMYAPKPKFDNTPQGRQKERLYGKKPEITAKETNEWLASLPPVEPVW